jgi:hypothetical protein
MKRLFVVWLRRTIGALWSALLATTVTLASAVCIAQPSYYGRWVASLAHCDNESAVMGPLVITPQSLQWPDTVCALRSSYRVGNLTHLALRCRDAATDLPAKLQMRGDRLVLDWGGLIVDNLHRCP